ncbi:helix-turn-helix transcriptional regulator [Streptomyces sp. PTM05]|uniref:Helix-turn-helix transcriptional regulator n=1 Tax=Streptantibioticus parmotrematis TaxID=2873249 RepID=A0ABS7QTS3_9ACTN|nr:helix-turn-helix transcriptional regulator [Streptantibioticus parmotrematis]MBY8885227.1 helix-turn-helix transcriptional regulator [Streptantibioticus parmotrematis]
MTDGSTSTEFEATGLAAAAASRLDATRIAVYRWVALHGSLAPAQVARDEGMSEQEVRDAAEALVELGLVQRDPEEDGRMWAVDPHLVAAVITGPLENSIRDQQTRLRTVRDQFARLAEFYDEGVRAAPADLYLIPGLMEVRAALNRAADECREEMLTVQPGGTRSAEVLHEALARDSRLLGRGIAIRTLYHHTARFNSPSQAYVASASAMGAQYRTAHQLFGRVIIFDRELAFLPDHRGTWGAVVIRQPSIVHFLCDLFEQTWAQARPFSDAATDGLETVAKELDRTIVGLLAAGLKDETIARRIGVSPRTVRKHIADIMQVLNAESRFQAGVLAAARGLLPGDPSAGADGSGGGGAVGEVADSTV